MLVLMPAINRRWRGAYGTFMVEWWGCHLLTIGNLSFFFCMQLFCKRNIWRKLAWSSWIFRWIASSTHADICRRALNAQLRRGEWKANVLYAVRKSMMSSESTSPEMNWTHISDGLLTRFFLQVGKVRYNIFLCVSFVNFISPITLIRREIF